MKPKGHTSVMASRAAVELELGAPGGDPLDYFPTPPWAARAGGELLARLDPLLARRTCWEPACGGGHMAHGLADYFRRVDASDIEDRGASDFTMDFLNPGGEVAAVDWIVTNPPFSDGETFARLAWARARVGVALLLRLSFAEGVARHQMFTVDCPLSVLAPFAERVPMVKGRWDPEASSATAYAWFVWLKPSASDVPGWAPRVHWIPPGSRERLTRPSDFTRFAPAEPSLAGDLFDERDA